METIKGFFLIGVSMYLMASFIFLCMGVADNASSDNRVFRTHTCEKLMRLDYIFPSYIVGCYLGEPVK